MVRILSYNLISLCNWSIFWHSLVFAWWEFRQYFNFPLQSISPLLHHCLSAWWEFCDIFESPCEINHFCVISSSTGIVRILPHISISAQSTNLLVHPLCISYATYFESPWAINHVQYLVLFGWLRCAVGYNEFDFFFRKLKTQPFDGWKIYIIYLLNFLKSKRLQKRRKSFCKCTKKSYKQNKFDKNE